MIFNPDGSPTGDYNNVVTADYREGQRLDELIAVLLACPHGHRFVVTQEPDMIYCSDSALACIRSAMEQ